MDFSFSQIHAVLSCHYKYDLAYVQRWTRRIDAKPLTKGSLVHRGMEAGLKFYAADQTADVEQRVKLSQEAAALGVRRGLKHYMSQRPIMEEEEPILEEIAAESENVARRAIREFLSEYEPLVVTHEGSYAPAVEFKFRLPIPGSKHFFIGLIDVLAKERRTGMNWLVDFKVRKQMTPVEDEELNIQMAAYQWGLGHLFPLLRMAGSIAYQIAEVPPSEPKVNKDGSMSRADCRTTWEIYRAALERNNLDPDDYREMEAKLNTKEWFRPSRAYRGQFEVDTLWNELFAPAIEQSRKLRSRRKKSVVQRSMSAWNCKGCQFREPCLEALRGGDVEYILKTNFIDAATIKREEPIKISEEEDQ